MNRTAQNHIPIYLCSVLFYIPFSKKKNLLIVSFFQATSLSSLNLHTASVTLPLTWLYIRWQSLQFEITIRQYSAGFFPFFPQVAMCEVVMSLLFNVSLKVLFITTFQIACGYGYKQYLQSATFRAAEDIHLPYISKYH